MWKKLCLRRLLKNNKGFTLVEVILSISLISLISLTVFYLLSHSILTSNTSNYKDEILSNGRYGFEYISGELRRADKIISPIKISGFNTLYPQNLGFIIYNYNEDKNPKGNHEYTSYYIKEGVLYRIKCRKVDKKYPDSVYFEKASGINFLSENIKKNNTFVDFEKNIIGLNFTVGDKDFSYKFNSVFNMNCIIDY